MSSETNKWGFPHPGVQSPTPRDATAPHFFVDDKTWEDIIKGRQFDDIVVGTGFCAWAYVTEALKRDPFRKILMLERGGSSSLSSTTHHHSTDTRMQSFGSLITSRICHSLSRRSLEALR